MSSTRRQILYALYVLWICSTFYYKESCWPDISLFPARVRRNPFDPDRNWLSVITSLYASICIRASIVLDFTDTPPTYIGQTDKAGVVLPRTAVLFRRVVCNIPAYIRIYIYIYICNTRAYIALCEYIRASIVLDFTDTPPTYIGQTDRAGIILARTTVHLFRHVCNIYLNIGRYVHYGSRR